MKRNPNLPALTAEVKAAIVRDYLRGDKTIVITFRYKISPGEMYRILHAHQVRMRSTKSQPPMIFPQLTVGNRFKVDIWKLMLATWNMAHDTTREMLEVIISLHLEEDPRDMLVAIGCTDYVFTEEKLILGGFQLLIEYVLSYNIQFEHIKDDEWRVRGAL